MTFVDYGCLRLLTKPETEILLNDHLQNYLAAPNLVSRLPLELKNSKVLNLRLFPLTSLIILIGEPDPPYDTDNKYQPTKRSIKLGNGRRPKLVTLLLFGSSGLF